MSVRCLATGRATWRRRDSLLDGGGSDHRGPCGSSGGADRVRRVRLGRVNQFQTACFGDSPEIKRSTEVPGIDACEG
jgi:hypothetical protein